jgi:Toastrack DUF4097
MRATRLSPIDITGITLGTIVILVVIGSIAFIVRGRMFGPSWIGARSWSSWEQGWSHGALREEKDDQVAGDITTIEIRNIAGSIDIHAGTADAVGIHSVKTAMFPAAMQNVTVGIEKLGTRLLVEERHDGGFFMSAGTVSFTITVPRGVKTIEAHSVSGSVTVRDVPPGIDQNLSTISGSISTSRAGNFVASSTSGSIRFDFAGRELDAHTVSGSIDGRIRSLDKGGTLSMRSVSGSVAVEAFPGLGAAASLHSVSGGISCEFPVAGADQGRHSVEGRIGDGAGRLEINTTSGRITIRKM